MMKRLEKARKKAEALEGADGDGVSEKEKWQQIKRCVTIYEDLQFSDAVTVKWSLHLKTVSKTRHYTCML